MDSARGFREPVALQTASQQLRRRGIVNALELRIPPLIVVLVTGLLMWFAASKASGWRFSVPFQGGAATVLVLVGMAITLRGVIKFRGAKTTVNPTKPQSSSSLVKSGIYRRTRNPMYLGFLLVLSGWSLWLANIAAFAFVPVFVLYMNRFQIAPEERALESLFGEDFKSYRSEVRRWI
jgi:protein-S-isoprenylcysteine O-methyltransferase Ste14